MCLTHSTKQKTPTVAALEMQKDHLSHIHQIYQIPISISKQEFHSDINYLLSASWGPLLETQNNLVNLIKED